MSPLYWYECDLLPLVGLVRAPDAESAREAAHDDAVTRLREFLGSADWKLTEVMTELEGEVRSGEHS